MSSKERLYEIIKKPIITEKSMMATAMGQYTFEVLEDATKVEIARTVYMPSHSKRMGYKFGRTDSSRKAIVTIEGDPIEELVGA